MTSAGCEERAESSWSAPKTHRSGHNNSSVRQKRHRYLYNALEHAAIVLVHAIASTLAASLQRSREEQICDAPKRPALRSTEVFCISR